MLREKQRLSVARSHAINYHIHKVISVPDYQTNNPIRTTTATTADAQTDIAAHLSHPQEAIASHFLTKRLSFPLKFSLGCVNAKM